MKHTPGPWEYRKRKQGAGEIISTIRNANDRPTLICFMGHNCAPAENYLENARLIASAPELLEAARAILAMEHLMTTRKGWNEYRALEAAVLKAEGGGVTR